MNKTILIAKTPKDNIKYSIQVETTTVKSIQKYINVDLFNECCKTGCKNYGMKWSCPPYAPRYENYTKKYRLINVIILQLDLSQFTYIKNDYLKVKAANSILKSRIDKTLRSFKSLERHYISTGSCRLCKTCKRKINLPCSHPQLMTYSFEALGINVSLLVQDLFDTTLLWYSKHNLPKYTSVVAGLLCNEEIDQKIIINKLMELN